MEPKNYIELPQDEFGNVAYLINGQRVVIVAFKFGNSLRIVAPMSFMTQWPTVKAAGWKEVDAPAGVITVEEWRRLVAE